MHWETRLLHLCVQKILRLCVMVLLLFPTRMLCKISLCQWTVSGWVFKVTRNGSTVLRDPHRFVVMRYKVCLAYASAFDTIFLGHRTLARALFVTCRKASGEKWEFTPHFSCVWHIHVRVRKYLALYIWNKWLCDFILFFFRFHFVMVQGQLC